MYIVTIVNVKTGNQVGPTIFTGESEDFPSLKAGLDAAKMWAAKQINSEYLQVKSKIVGCL